MGGSAVWSIHHRDRQEEQTNLKALMSNIDGVPYDWTKQSGSGTSVEHTVNSAMFLYNGAHLEDTHEVWFATEDAKNLNDLNTYPKSPPEPKQITLARGGPRPRPRPSSAGSGGSGALAEQSNDQTVGLHVRVWQLQSKDLNTFLSIYNLQWKHKVHFCNLPAKYVSSNVHLVIRVKKSSTKNHFQL